MNSLKLIVVFAVASLVASCGVESQVGTKSPVKKDDKFLTCDEIMLEINDAQFYKEQAEKNKGLNLRNVVWPVGYPYTYSSAEEAIELSNARIQYLSNIYQIKKCDSDYHRPRQ